MTATAHSCAVCGASPSKASGIVRATVETRTIFLCRAHAAIVVAARPATFEELRALFVGTTLRKDAPGVDWRSPIPRRLDEDRRAFPPRPEGRRLSAGRRSTD
jgi:hypothetical protein